MRWTLKRTEARGPHDPGAALPFLHVGCPIFLKELWGGDKGLSSSAFSSVRGGCCLLELVLACGYNVVKSEESYGGCPWHRCPLIQVSPA